MKMALRWCSLVAVPFLVQGAAISGHVTGSNKKCIPNAVVIVMRADSEWKRLVLSDRDGYYILDHLPSGRYRVEAVKPGLTLAQKKIIDAGPGRPAAVNLRMTVQKASTSESEGVACRTDEKAKPSVVCSSALFSTDEVLVSRP